MPQIGKVLISFGIVMFFIGCILVFFSDKLKWFGNMPLDFSYEGDSTLFFAPIRSMIFISLILSIIAIIIFRFFLCSTQTNFIPTISRIGLRKYV